MSRYGYARVSTVSQNIKPQVNALNEAGCIKVFEDKKSGKNLDREGLHELLSELNNGDTLVITKMDRIARNVKEGITLIDELNEKGIIIHVLNMGVFDGTPNSNLLRNVLLAVAEFERDMMLERQREGIEDAKQRGVYKGRPKKYTERNKSMQYALELYDNRDSNKMTVKDIVEITKVSKATLYRVIREREESES